MKRRDKHNYYLDIAQTVLERGTCLRRNYGAIIVKTMKLFHRLYRGSAPQKNCTDIGICRREQLKIPAARDMSCAVRCTEQTHNQCFKKGYAWFGNVFGRKRHEYG